MEYVRTTVKIPNELHQLLKDEAEKQKRSVHNLILMILWSYFGK